MLFRSRQDPLAWARGARPAVTTPAPAHGDEPGRGPGDTDRTRYVPAPWEIDDAATRSQGTASSSTAYPNSASPTSADPTRASSHSTAHSGSNEFPNATSGAVPAPNVPATRFVAVGDSPLNPAAAAILAAATSEASSPVPGVQFLNRYLVTADEDGILIIDQHALHERILYEQLRMRAESKRLETQRLLVPEPIDLTGAEMAIVLESRDALAELGIVIEPFGGDSVVITTYPAMLARTRPAALVRQVVETLMEGKRCIDKRDLLDEILNMVACKAAVKAGDPLSPEEIAALLEQRHLFRDTHHCPHGRPTALVFSRDELDRRFKRI